MTLSIALQLFSVRDEAEKDFIETLQRVAEIGYHGVEFAGYGGLTSSELKKVLEDLKLKPCGSHVSIDDLENRLDDVITYNVEIGNKYIICPWYVFESKKDYLHVASVLKEAAKKCKNHNLKIGFHNHANEFIEYDGQRGLDLLLDQSGDEVIVELDTYWVEYAGINPISYMEKYQDRCKLLHIKDMEIVEGEKRSTEVGNGIMDISSIVEAAKKSNVEWLVVEQEFFTKPSLQSVSESFEYLNNLLRN
ncbi:sugar phosphate isomerase/epimerase family protein [Bacillus sp. JJ722]|uniref:sugar phosphate isomerase/epimerase family protein n=1 Tax=Bacillus sp. JJ722 TaxID=3122973 RepID=UPI00300037D2